MLVDRICEGNNEKQHWEGRESSPRYQICVLCSVSRSFVTDCSLQALHLNPKKQIIPNKHNIIIPTGGRQTSCLLTIILLLSSNLRLTFSNVQLYSVMQVVTFITGQMLFGPRKVTTTKACYKHCATAVSNSIDCIKFDSSTTWFQMSCYCRVKLNL